MDHLTEPDERSKQRLVGPSEIGGCAYCLGVRISSQYPEIYPEMEFQPSPPNYPAWLGTAVHYFLEHTIPFGEHEISVPIAEIEGYGHIKGHIDFYCDGEIIDFKNLGKVGADKAEKTWNKERGILPSVEYRVQQHLYGYGVRQTGRECTHVNLMVLPKTGKSFRDIRFYREPYNQEVVDRSLDRLKLIVQTVREGNLEEIPKGDECYTCNFVAAGTTLTRRNRG